MQIILENLYKAYFEARKNKRFTKEQQKQFFANDTTNGKRLGKRI